MLCGKAVQLFVVLCVMWLFGGGVESFIFPDSFFPCRHGDWHTKNWNLRSFLDCDFHGWDWSAIRRRKPWFEGPNVCIREHLKNETVDPEERFIKTETDVTVDYRRIKTTEIKNGTRYTSSKIYECCHGYARKQGQKCHKVHGMVDLLETMAEIDSLETSKAMKVTGLSDQFTNRNFTILAPTDEAMKEFLEKEKRSVLPNEKVVIIDGTISDEAAVNTNHVLKAHVIPGIFHSYDLSYLGEVETVADNVKIRFSTTPKFLLANCVKVVRKDKQATNGIVHQVNRVLRPVESTIQQYIFRNPEFSQLKTVAGRIGFEKLLEDMKDFTMFLPSNAAFEKLDREILESTESLTALLKNHIVTGSLCSACIGNNIARSLAGEKLKFRRSRDDKLFVNGAQITLSDVVATNGVIHLIDDILVPDQAKDILSVMQSMDYSTAVELINEAMMTDLIKQLRNFTMFLPTNGAFRAYFRRHGQSNPDALRNLLLYHVVVPMVSEENFTQSTSLQSLLPSHSIDLRVYREFGIKRLQLQCNVRGSAEERKVLGGNFYPINQVLEIPDQSLLEVLRSRDDLAIFTRLLERSEVPEIIEKGGNYTVFAPSDHAFDRLSHDSIDEMFPDDKELNEFVKAHFIEGPVCANRGYFYQRRKHRTLAGLDISFGGWRPLRSLFSKHYHMHSDFVEQNLVASNGIVHILADDYELFDSFLRDFLDVDYWKRMFKNTRWW